MTNDDVIQLKNRVYNFDQFKVNVAYRFSRDKKPLIVLLNGAVDRSRSLLPVYQRSTWIDEIDAHCIFVSDPTLSIRDDLSLGWGLGNLGTHGIDVMAKAILSLHDENSENVEGPIRFFGSSAGGFQALCLASRLKGNALAINPQIRVTDYFEKEVVKALFASLGTFSQAVALGEFAQRIDVFEYFKSVNHIPRAKIVINSSSHDDMRRDHRRITEWLNSNPPLVEPFSVDYYSNLKLGHNPPPKRETLDLISELLS